MPGADCCATIETRKPSRAQQIGRAIAVDADQVGHDVAGAVLAAVDEQPHFGGARVRRGILRDDDVRRDTTASRISAIVGRADAFLGQADLRGALGFADQLRRDDDPGTGTEPDADAALAPRARARRGFLAEDHAGRHLGIGPADLLDSQGQALVGGERPRLVGEAGRSASGTRTSWARTATRAAMTAKMTNVASSPPASTSQLAGVPDSATVLG